MNFGATRVLPRERHLLTMEHHTHPRPEDCVKIESPFWTMEEMAAAIPQPEKGQRPQVISDESGDQQTIAKEDKHDMSSHS